MAYPYKKKSAEERKIEIDTLTDHMNETLQNYAVNLTDLKAFLAFMDQFRDYSLKNQLLIRSQFQGAYGVASFKTFKDWGFSVLKGEKGIKIFVPVEIKQFKTKQGTWKNISYATKEEQAYLAAHQDKIEIRKRLGFKLGTVFDVTQTNAKPEDYPTLFPNRKNDFHYAGEDLTVLKQTLVRYASNQNIPVETAKITNSAAKGYYRPDTHTIVLSDRNSESENIHTLIHELAHAVLHNQEKMAQKAEDLQRTPVIEYQAEMTAYIVAHHFGLDTEVHSLQYTAQWTKNLKEVTQLTEALEETRTASYAIIEALEAILENELINNQEIKENAQEAKNNDFRDHLYAIKTIEPIASIGNSTVYDLKLQSETNEVQNYRILTNHSPSEIGEKWAGSKTKLEWKKENTLTDFLEKHPDVASGVAKFKNLEKILSGSPEPLPIFVAARQKDLNNEMSL
ncbi:ImmA/IrrE family metallo-endopeptidase [Jeotgalibaca caeni]|uniref:ImmA/IrrE family metallo-endopeptidase n=1 Tax=Jeotgalibaca caeni TaxID=3028623 RepID=UPI00237E8BFC|nr:ImmA/IrrE family metallo-endopeptidase [Jeotgalibaca caeni]MDE1548517.1 ArdC-like ssDNA-binding domain-containing protein [Jeotgalibaca caeni]